MSYNGWKNKETWLVNLWLGDSLTMDQEAGCEINAAYIELMVEVFVEECSPDANYGEMNGFIADLLNCALGEIDYDELASHYEEDE
jgi:hypothetical protein